ncbi:MAG: glycosyltransferase family 4 protein [Lacrimispora sp.]|uniref:glycosyltransferase family 4 protein n=1 Tax=Lacrimispora sp. TaxID=2719234 RepID=UPI0039E51AFE
MNHKPIIMLHYVKEGLVRSPNIIFDRIESCLNIEDYHFIHLNQRHLPSEIGIFQVIKELYLEIRANKPSIIHISGIQEGFACMIAAFLAGCSRRILITHGFASEVPTQSWYKRALFKYFTEPITLLLAREVQCNSWFSYNHKLVRTFARKRRRVIYNIPLERESNLNKKGFRDEYNIDSDMIIFVSVGNVEIRKGFKELSNIIFDDTNNKSCFVIVGDGAYLEEMKQKLKNQIERKKVIFLGRISNEGVYHILKESNVFVLPTHFETYGLVYIEAAFAKLPSIGTNICAIPEVVKNGETGILIESKNERQLKEAIQYFVQNPQKAKKMGEYAYEWAIETFDRNKIVKQIDNMYQELLRC